MLLTRALFICCAVLLLLNLDPFTYELGSVRVSGEAFEAGRPASEGGGGGGGDQMLQLSQDLRPVQVKPRESVSRDGTRQNSKLLFINTERNCFIIFIKNRRNKSL